MVTVVPDLEGLADQVTDTAGGPGVVLVSMRQGALPQEGPQLSLLIGVSREGGPGATVA